LGCATTLRDERHIPFAFNDGRIRGMDSQRTFFVTTVTWQRRPIFRDEPKVALLLELRPTQNLAARLKLPSPTLAKVREGWGTPSRLESWAIQNLGC